MTSSSDVKPEYLRSLKVATSGAAPLGYSDELRFKEKIKNENAFIRQGIFTKVYKIFFVIDNNLF